MIRLRLSDYLDLKEMRSGQYGFALNGVRKLAGEKGLPHVVALADDGIAKARVSQSLDFAWDATKKQSKSSASGPALASKNSIVRQLSSIAKIVEGRAEGDDDEITRMAVEFQRDVLANGVEPLRQQQYVVLLGTVDTMFRDHFRSSKKRHVEQLGIQREVDRLARLAEELRANLTFTRPKKLTFATVEKARDAAHEATARVVVAVLNQFSGEDEQSVRDREALLEPINYQQEVVTQARAHHRQPADVDVDTGEELDVDVDDDEEVVS